MPARRWAVRIETRRRRARRIRDALGRHALVVRAGGDAGAASARPRPRRARGDLAGPQARGARLRPHGPRPARHRAVGPGRAAARRSRCAPARRLPHAGCRPMPAPITARRSRAGSTRPRPSPTMPRPAAQQGFAGFKIHGWHDGDVPREVANVLGRAPRRRRRVPLMLDPACQLRTWMDALAVGRACDEAGFFWYEDPYRDTGVAAEGHKRLRERLRTPLLVVRARARPREQGGLHAGRRRRHDPRRPGIRHGHHRRDEDRRTSARRSGSTCSITPAGRRTAR